ncbi:MAG: hypothetical protein F6K25_04345 [Okeania sp. SIO2G4]|uniref:hypothetical protein n=1 Tax=unclassified Okeania TaxID=2634635 RepID=UPI0013B9561F|nr:MULTISPECIES: hypothetical protein [unclassified Okeania]NEP04864.1 hypothetical protein [Okeania sp. SIO4D6]NEP44209.1 hypothetical protein [Okeania sp. SIO2H7]NEP70953.1 hypothetical protein [Okeania sp. SIO2G5]NEP92267.1 hypothetical protein [Okeania sp. SIO2F5]NEQ90005.1 hypothetical protein [Okeania sp. SIO2G4]
MPELKIKCQHPELLKNTIENMISDRVKSLKSGIVKTKKRILEFEEKYQLSTQEFLLRYENDEFEETLELDEWIGEALMLKRLEEKIDTLGDIEFVI